MAIIEQQPTRRDFIKTAGTVGLAVSSVAYSPLAKACGANERIRIGVMGAGGRARQLMDHLVAEPRHPVQGGIPQWKTQPVAGAQVVAVADVYEPNREQAAAEAGSATAKFSDYRKLLEQKDIDAVIIASPDHWHKQMLLDAVAAGKDVYVEKPVTHTLDEGPEEIMAVEKSGRIVQTGTQQRSWAHYVQGKQLVASGALGEVRLVDAFWFMNYGVRTAKVKNPPNETPPAKLDWKAWLGSAPDQPFSEMKFRVWRQFWDFGGGNLCDLMTHAIETVHWYMECDTPTSAVGIGHAYDWSLECPDNLTCTLEYPKGFLVTYEGSHTLGMDFGSIIFRGSKATLEISRAALALYEEVPGRGWPGYNQASRNWRPEPKLSVESEYEGTSEHLRNWLDCIRSRKEPNAGIRVGVAAARAAHLGNLALRTGKKVTWDEKQQKPGLST
ncbi:MAG: Gfo/Idh/MocA family protein [Planctomycetaceae bacterium]